MVYGQDFSGNKKERNLASLVTAQGNQQQGTGKFGTKRNHSMHGCPGDWIIVQRQEGDWGFIYGAE